MKPSVILLASKPGSALVLKKMLNAGWEVRCVVVPPKYDQSWMPSPSLEDVAAANKIPVKYNQYDVPLEKVDYVISYMYRNLVKSELIQRASLAALNFHPAPLPEFGGFAFYNVAIIEGSAKYGATCHHLDNGFDTGDLVKVRYFPINAEMETALTLERQTQLEMLLLFDEFMELAENDKPLPRIPQDPKRHRYLKLEEFERLKIIDASMPNDEIQKIARAFWFPPYNCAYLKLADDKKVQIIPDQVLDSVGEVLHANDYSRLKNISS